MSNNGHETIESILASLGRDPDTAANILSEAEMDSMVDGLVWFDIEDTVRQGLRTLAEESI